MSKKFPYDYDINKYLDKALEKLKETYPWAELKMLKYKYEIEKENNKYEYISYYKWNDGEIERKIIDGDGEEFIERIINDNYYWIEDANPIKETFKFPLPTGVELHGWYLERYEFNKHIKGGYSAFVQAGNRSTGGSRTFFIPPKYLEGTFEEFLDEYIKLVPASFGLTREDLRKIDGLKEFLGFKGDENE